MDVDIQSSHLRLRKAIGILGLLLPILVYVFHGGLLTSISHYYYTDANVFFITIISAFGLFLISYRGYPAQKEEWLSDDSITTIGGIGALLLVLFPTYCKESGSVVIDNLCSPDDMILYYFKPNTANVIHFIGAGVFIFSVACMSYFKFTLGKPDGKHWLYKASGIVIWICLLVLLVETLIGKSFTDYDTFIFETIAVFAFGISWSVKGKVLGVGSEVDNTRSTKSKNKLNIMTDMDDNEFWDKISKLLKKEKNDAYTLYIFKIIIRISLMMILYAFVLRSNVFKENMTFLMILPLLIYIISEFVYALVIIRNFKRATKYENYE